MVALTAVSNFYSEGGYTMLNIIITTSDVHDLLKNTSTQAFKLILTHIVHVSTTRKSVTRMLPSSVLH